MERAYTESELRQRMYDKAPEIADSLIARLIDDGLFLPKSFSLKGTLNADGTYTFTDLAPLQKIVTEGLGLVLREYQNALLTALFEE